MKVKLSLIFLFLFFIFLSFSTIAQSSNVLVVEITGTDGMKTFGQRVKKAWKNINEIKPKKKKKN